MDREELARRVAGAKEEGRRLDRLNPQDAPPDHHGSGGAFFLWLLIAGVVGMAGWAIERLLSR